MRDFNVEAWKEKMLDALLVRLLWRDVGSILDSYMDGSANNLA
jgi:hypothetical protein